jgi:hypothetical protein
MNLRDDDQVSAVALVVESEAPTAAPVAGNGATEPDEPGEPDAPDTASETENGADADADTDTDTDAE